MARPHIVWVHAQALPWRRGAIAARATAQAKILLPDAETGAVPRTLRYPAGYARDLEWLSVDEEVWSIGGPKATGWEDPDRPFTGRPAHVSILPPELHP